MSLSPCCLSGHQHEGSPQGSFRQVGGLRTYVAGEENKAKTIVVITDIFGVELKNVQLIADEYAKTGGFRVIVPDVFDGDAVPAEHMKTLTPLKSDPARPKEELEKAQGAVFGGTVGPWLGRQGDDVVRPRINKVVDAVSGESGVETVGAVGFCWGARQALLLADGKSKIATVVANHPSFTEYPDVFKAVNVPTLIQAPEEDGMFPADQSADVKKNIFPGKKGSSVLLYKDAVHGFACRGDLNNDEERKLQDEATRKTIDHLRQYL